MADLYWQTICGENSLLRALFDRMLVSVTEDVDDTYMRRLLKNIPQQELPLS